MNPFLAGVLVLVAVFGVLLTLEVTGKTDLGLKRLWSGGGEVRAANSIPVVLSMLPMQPGEQVTVPALWNQEQNTYNHMYIDKGAVAEKNYLDTPELVVGRVLRRPKPAGQAFTEFDFLPPGSKPGITGLVPDGMEALSIPADRIPGLTLLAFGDLFDLRRTVEAEQGAKEMAEEILRNRSYSSEADRLRLASIVRGPAPRLLAQAGVVLRPSSGVFDPRNKEKIVVAVHPDDLDGVIAALDAKGDIHCSPRKKTSEDALTRVEVVEVDPMEEYAWVLEISREVEVIQGDESEMKNVPAAQISDVARPAGDPSDDEPK